MRQQPSRLYMHAPLPVNKTGVVVQAGIDVPCTPDGTIQA